MTFNETFIDYLAKFYHVGVEQGRIYLDQLENNETCAMQILMARGEFYIPQWILNNDIPDSV